MEGISGEALQTLAEVPEPVLRELKEMPPEVLRALREVRLEALKALGSGDVDGRSGWWTGSGDDEVGKELQRTIDRAYRLMRQANLNVVGTMGLYRRGEEDAQGWINFFLDSGGGGVDRILNTPVDKVAEALSILGSEVRLTILRSLFDGPKSASELVEALGLGTTGQAYHHVRELKRIHAVEAREGKYHFKGGFTRVYLTALLVAAEAGHTGPYARQEADEEGG
jgi:DNA-binding transcriptional ArsR family regulator